LELLPVKCLIEYFCDFITVLRRLKTEHIGFKSTIVRLQAQSADPGTAIFTTSYNSENCFYKVKMKFLPKRGHFPKRGLDLSGYPLMIQVTNSIVGMI